MRNPRPDHPHRNRVVEVAIGLAIAGVVGAASIPVIAALFPNSPPTCAERVTSDHPCGVRQVGSVQNP